MASQVVISIFPDEAAADAAVNELKSWGELDDEIKLSAIGIMAVGDDGKLKTHKVGSHSAAKGAGIGVILSLVAPVTLLGGLVAGTAVGAFHSKGLGLSGADRERIAGELTNGKAAVGVLANDENAASIAAKLEELGGQSESHDFSDEAMAEAAAAADAPASTPG
jgi:hypothetical protein